MKKFTVCLAVLMIALMVGGGSAWAYDASEHVKAAPNGKGDLLFFPYFYAYPGDYATKITIINTSEERSVVAKVVYRSFNWSVEVLDHMLYLSPSDVWTGWLVNVDGVARLQSTDDSILGRPTTYPAKDEDFGNVTPVNQALSSIYLCTDDVNTMGYIEVIEAAQRLESIEATGYAPRTRVSKKHIFDWYDQFVENVDLGPGGQYAPMNLLTGYQENTFGGVGATLKRADVFADYHNTNRLIISAESTIGTLSRNNLSEVEAAMAKTNVGLPYVSKENGDYSVHVFNFPTKMSTFGNSTCNEYYPNDLSPYWTRAYWERATDRRDRGLDYTIGVYDLLENKAAGAPFSPKPLPTMYGEVEFTIRGYSNPAFTEGWAKYVWATAGADGVTRGGSTISFTGTPVLTSVLYWGADRSSPAEANAVYDDARVYVYAPGTTPILIPFYQYTDN